MLSISIKRFLTNFISKCLRFYSLTRLYIPVQILYKDKCQNTIIITDFNEFLQKPHISLEAYFRKRQLQLLHSSVELQIYTVMTSALHCLSSALIQLQTAAPNSDLLKMTYELFQK